MDIYCPKCSEPWDSYGITIDVGDGDLTAEEARRFRRGEGCPACDFGTNDHVLPAAEQGAAQNRALAALLAASDEEPIGILAAFLAGQKKGA